MATINPKGVSNWKDGKKGFQSALNNCQQIGLMLAWQQNNWKNSSGSDFLKTRYKITLPVRTLSAYKRRLRNYSDQILGSEHLVVDWGDFEMLNKYGIPQSQFKQLFEMNEFIQKMCMDVGVDPISPTYRSLKWWAYVNEYFSDSIVNATDRQIIGDQFFVRDLFSIINKTDILRSDLDMWLMYKPWISQSNMNSYISKISDGSIIPVDIMNSGWGIEIADNSDGSRTYPKGYGLSVLNWLLSTSPEPFILPSQIIEKYSIFAKH
ncbi:MAG: hypothetical protein MK345_02970 [SAR202 cluster bacterium]|nr:hypothetical protein [SAR202 cluster bacterium]